MINGAGLNILVPHSKLDLVLHIVRIWVTGKYQFVAVNPRFATRQDVYLRAECNKKSVFEQKVTLSSDRTSTEKNSEVLYSSQLLRRLG